MYDAEAKRLVLSATFVHLTESGEGDLQGFHPGQSIAVLVDPGVVWTNTTALTGATGISKSGAGRLVFAAESPDFSGPVSIGGSVVEGVVSNAFGTGVVSLVCSTTASAQIVLGSTTVNTAYDNDFVFEGDSSSAHPALKFITEGRRVTVVNGDITATGDLYLADSASDNGQGYDLVYLKGDVDVSGHTLNYKCDSNVRWQGRVTSETFVALSGYPSMGSHWFYATGNVIGRIRFDYNSIRLAGANALNGAVLDFSGNVNEGNTRGGVYLNGYDQTVAYLVRTTTAATEVRHFDQGVNTPSTLTLTGGVAEASISVRFGLRDYNDTTRYGLCSLVVDAGNDDFVQILTNSVCETKGTFTVKNGTLRFAGASSLTNAPSLTVAGGRLELDMTRANACESVTNVTLGTGSALRFGPDAATPFGANPKTDLDMAGDSSLELPEGAAVTVSQLYIDGLLRSPGTYTGMGGVRGTVLRQISGTGTLTVLRGSGLLIIFR